MKKLYILAKANPKLSQNYIDFNLKAALKCGWLIECKPKKTKKNED